MTPQEIEALIVEGLTDKVESLSAMVELLKAERDALAAQSECLRKHLKLAISVFEQYEIDVGEHPTFQHNKMMQKLIGSTESTTQQCLRDVQAEAGRAGYLQGLLSVLEEMEEYGAADVRNAEREADKYAAKVRKGGAE